MSIEGPDELKRYDEMSAQELQEHGDKLHLAKVEILEERLRLKYEIEKYDLIPQDLKSKQEEINDLLEKIENEISTVYDLIAQKK